jgi:predicted transcriptional regulator
MSNILKGSMIKTVKQLGSLGRSIRRIAKELGVNRRTVRKYLAENSNCTISTAGRRSLCAVHDEYIQERIKLGLRAQRIFQDLQLERAFTGGYGSVKSYVRKIEAFEAVSFRRMEVLPGTECLRSITERELGSPVQRGSAERPICSAVCSVSPSPVGYGRLVKGSGFAAKRRPLVRSIVVHAAQFFAAIL